MKHITFLYSKLQVLQKASKKAQKKKYKSQLIQIFTAQTDKKEIQKILQTLKEYFPEAQVIGATTAGEISHAKMYDNETVVSLSLFEKAQLHVAYERKITAKSAKRLSAKICTKETKAVVLLSEGLHGKDYEAFVSSLTNKDAKLVVAGGLAGDNFLLQKTMVFLGTTIYEEGVVGVSFSAKELYAHNEYNLNWIPIGKKFRVTQVEGNELVTIDNEPAKDVFQRYLGDVLFANNASALPDIQLLYNVGTTTVARTPLAVEKKKILLAGPIKTGQTFHFGFSNASAVVSGSYDIANAISKKSAQAIYVYSCIARKTLLGKSLEKEFSSFESVAPTAGFFTYGEFYSTKNANALLNCTTTLLILSETKKRHKTSVSKISQKNLENTTFNLLSHFVKQTSLELEENTELLHQYKMAVDATMLISKTDLEGNITYVNDMFCKVSRYTKEELLGQKHSIVRDPTVFPFVFKKLWNTISQGRIWKGTFPNRAKDGSKYYVNATVLPIFDNNKNIKEYIAIRQDITKQIQSKKRIEEKERLIKAILDNQESIVIYASKTKGMMNINKKFFDSFDFKNLEAFKAKYSCICDLFLEEEGYTYPSRYQDWLDDIAEGKTKIQKAKMRLKDGTVHTYNITIKKMEDEYIINLNDITELEEALTQAYVSEKAKGTFLANMSHEIRTPLNGILGFTDVLRKKELDKDTARYVDIIHKSGQTLLNVVNDILDFSKLESGELVLYETEADLFGEMEAAVSTFASVSKNKNIEYYTFIDTAIPRAIKCDIQRIKQVMNNLISNAIKFTPEGGEVHVKIATQAIENDEIVIDFSVKDSGIGIAEDKITTIFQAFSQADNSISREFGGTGLGLSISSQYITMMHSQLKVKSELGKGSLFYFRLKLPIVNTQNSFETTCCTPLFSIKLLAPKEEPCGINPVVMEYLNSWKCFYTVISSIDEIDADTDVVIIGAKLFNQDQCKKALDKHEKLHLIYIEGSQNNFNCVHDKFHFIEQPMTGSALFDKLVTLTHTNIPLVKKETREQNQKYTAKILVAEDNETNQMLISLLLHERGIEVTMVENGREAVDEALNNEYDLIFMDINMPVLDGISATKELRKASYTKPIISLSANVIESDLLSYRDAGMNNSLNKPIVPQELDSILHQYLQKEEAHEIQEDFDVVDVANIAKALSIPSEEIILKLLKSFLGSISDIKQKISAVGLNKDVAHNLKGISGNLRFEKLHQLMIKFEQGIEYWQEDEKEKETQRVLSHLEHLSKQIEAII